MDMRAVVRRGDRLTVETIDRPVPAQGQVLIRVRACGICGSDLHALASGDRRRQLAQRAGFGAPQADDVAMVFGHEFCGEVVAYGENTGHVVPVGSLVTAAPYIEGPHGPELVGFSSTYPGGYGEYLVASANLVLPVPDSMTASEAALTEPFAVGLHSVEEAGLAEGDVAVVVGCGPVGLAIVAWLKLRGVRWIAVSDRAAFRRDMARQLGADVVLDPSTGAMSELWPGAGVDTRRRNPMQRRDQQSAPRSRCVIFECVGKGGVLGALIEAAPPYALIVSVGASQETDRIEPWIATVKQIDLRFVHAYTIEEFEATLAAMADGSLDVRPVITGEVGLDGVADAFAALASPDRHIKIIINPELGKP